MQFNLADKVVFHIYEQFITVWDTFDSLLKEP